MQAALCWLWIVLIGGSAGAAEPPPEEDPLAIAALLVSDGRLSQAAAVLGELEPTAPGLDRPRYWSLTGIVALQQQDYAAADVAFGRSAAEAVAGCEAEGGEDCDGAADPLLFLSQARARLLNGDPEGALAALDQRRAALADWPGSFLVEARAQEELGSQQRAWTALEAGARAHPEVADFPRQQLLLLVRMGLYREAGDRALAMTQDGTAGLADTVAIAEALRRAGAHDRAAMVLEEARLRFPEAVEPRVRLAAVYSGAGKPLAAARLLQEAAALEPKWALAAAELYRDAGRPEQALFLNAQVLEPDEKVKQRFGLLLDSQDFERAVALEPRLTRLGLVQGDESLRYGLAYAWFRVGGWDRAEALLQGISDSQLFRDALALREAIGRCREEEAACQ